MLNIKFEKNGSEQVGIHKVELWKSVTSTVWQSMIEHGRRIVGYIVACDRYSRGYGVVGHDRVLKRLF